MILPRVHGQNTQQSFYIYAACDSNYFEQFAPSLINSVIANTDHGLHLHLFNPKQEQIKLCQQSRMSVTWETVDIKHIDQMTKNFVDLTEEQQRRTKISMIKGNDQTITDRMLKTYYACARFIRLHEQFHTPVFAIDVDAIVRKPIPSLSTDVEFYLHRIYGKKARCLAGGLYLNHRAGNFLTAYATALKEQVEKDYLYWSIDQDILDHIVPQYDHGQLPVELIDWEMQDSGIIWTAKGTRKDTEIFISEQKKYIA